MKAISRIYLAIFSALHKSRFLSKQKFWLREEERTTIKKKKKKIKKKKKNIILNSHILCEVKLHSSAQMMVHNNTVVAYSKLTTTSIIESVFL